MTTTSVTAQPIQEQRVKHSTFVITRTYPVPSEKVFAAFADPVKKRRWYVDRDELTVEKFTMDFRVGGTDYTHFATPKDSPLTGATLTNRTVYQDIVPNRRIVLAYTMAVADTVMSASLSTFELLPSAKGTDLVFTEQAAFFENSDGPQMREAGWRELLMSLGVELSSEIR